jgi:hypothetical protein
MAILNSWQRIDRVLNGLPFGDSANGAYSSGTIPSLTYRSCSGTATSSTLTIASGGYSNGDVIAIFQMRGTGVGQWEINRVSSGGGTTSLTLQTPLKYTYTDSGASQAQCVNVPRYSTVNMSSGTWTVPDWNGDTGGVFVFAAKVWTPNGTISGSATGYRGGAAVGLDVDGKQGEGTVAAGGTISTAANGTGGGGGDSGSGAPNPGPGAGGGGGGHAASGTKGTNSSTGKVGGTGGTTGGSADLTNIILGGAGGSGGGDDNYVGDSGKGGDSGPIVIAFVDLVQEITGGVIVSGQNGNNAVAAGAGGGGGGSGGSFLLACRNATLGTNKIVSLGGTGGTATTGGGTGGTASVGRIAVHHSGTVTGTTNPTFTDVTDTTLIETGGAFLFNLI